MNTISLLFGLKSYGISSEEWNVKRVGTPPSFATMNTSKFPNLLLAKAIFFESFDQTGIKSYALCDVICFASPPFAPTTNKSPW